MNSLARLSGVLVLCACFFTAYAQVPNAGFEQWTSGEPDGWTTDNVVSFGVPITQSATARTGSSALAGEVVNTQIGLYAPVVQSGIGGNGTPVSQRYAVLTGYYRFTPVDGDRFSVNVGMMKSGNPIGAGAISVPTAVGTYTQFTVDIQYTTADVPDTCIIQITIIGPLSGTDFHLGSSFLVDDLVLSGVSSAEQNGYLLVPDEFALSQNFPNPFNPSTSMKYRLPSDGHARLSVYDLLVREVAILVDADVEAGEHTASWNADRMPSGVYVYRLETSSGMQMKRMTLMK